MKFNKKHKFIDFFDKIDEPRNIDFIIIHHIESTSLEDAILELKKFQVSSHFIIDEKGEIFLLVDENNIAYHAGNSYFKGLDGLNRNSIGIELLTKNAVIDGYKKEQMQNLVKICNFLVEKYNINRKNIISHSDIAYFKENGFLNRKQDVSHLFDWNFLAKNNLGIFYKIKIQNDKIIAKKNDKLQEIIDFKIKLQKFGYKIDNISDIFDDAFENALIVFHRHFNQEKFFVNEENIFFDSDILILNNLLSNF